MTHVFLNYFEDFKNKNACLSIGKVRATMLHFWRHIKDTYRSFSKNRLCFSYQKECLVLRKPVHWYFYNHLISVLSNLAQITIPVLPRHGSMISYLCHLFRHFIVFVDLTQILTESFSVSKNLGFKFILGAFLLLLSICSLSFRLQVPTKQNTRFTLSSASPMDKEQWYS